MTAKKSAKRSDKDAKSGKTNDPVESVDETIEAEESETQQSTPEPETPPEAVEILDPMVVITAERDDYRDKWLRAVAEQENLRKRTRREVIDAHLFTKVEMIRGLLEVLDNFDRAKDSLPEDADAHVEFSGFLNGVRLVHERLRTILEGHGLKPVEAEPGGEFDPVRHEAVAQLEDAEISSGAIIAVAQTGYMLGEIVVRPARVMVAK